MTAPMGRERTPGAVEEAIQELSMRGYTVAQIERELPGKVKLIAEEEGWKSWKVPSRRTIQRIARRAKPPDGGVPWRIEDSSPEDARFIFDFIVQGILNGLSTPWPSNDEAEWLVRIHRLAPELSQTNTLRIAFEYLFSRNRGLSTKALDGFMAFAPWQSDTVARAYAHALASGNVSPLSQAFLQAFARREGENVRKFFQENYLIPVGEGNDAAEV